MKGEPWTEEQKQAARERWAARKEANRLRREAQSDAAPDAPAAVAPSPEEVAPAVGLSDAQRLRIREEAKKQIDKELAARAEAEQAALLARTLEEEIEAQRREAGLTDYRDDMIDILIDVAPFTDRIVIDGTQYMHEHWYTVPRRKADVINEIMARSWDAEERAGNPNRRFRRTVAGSMNPMLNERRTPDGTLTIGLDTRVNRQGAAINRPSVGG
jgi:hypothetical protein